MHKPPLPSYSSPENTHFHPVFRAALEEVLTSRGLRHFAVKSQYRSPTGPIDLALFNETTSKVVLPIELKRTQSSVMGGGRRQARDYWTNLGSECETSFYCVSNLEFTELFRNDQHRPKTSSQRILLTYPIAGQLGVTPKKMFYDQMINCLNEIIDIITGTTTFDYATGLPEFQSNIERSTYSPDQWHKLFIPVCFEYIRGASTHIAHLRSHTSSWKEASFYGASPNSLLRLGRGIDFEHIFKKPAPDPKDLIAFTSSVLKEAYECGKESGGGDDIAELVNEILAPTDPGIVETDFELAHLLAIIARDALGRDISNEEEAFDPGSGSGRLLTVLPIAFPSIKAKQIKANEKVQMFAEPLSLRLGLAFAATLSTTNAPSITISDIVSIAPAYLERVRIVVMNPPYLSGVQSCSLKAPLISRIQEITGSAPLLNIGQVALEILFLELVWHLAQEGTVIATVFPFQHLCRTSSEVIEFRRFLTQQFGLTHIVIHPREGLFRDVIKQTVLLVGVKGSNCPNVKIVEVQKRVGNVDMSELLSNLNMASMTSTHGVSVKIIPRHELSSSGIEGWNSIIGIGSRTKEFINSYMMNFLSIADLGSNITRGTIGNSGNTALTVFGLTSPKYPTVIKLIPHAWIKPAMNRTENMPRVLKKNSAPDATFLPPSTAYIKRHPDNSILKKIIRKYLSVNKPSQRSQKKAVKSLDTIIENLKRDQKDKGAGWVLIQRASREKGEIGLLEIGGILTSTNVPMLKLPLKHRKLMASWLLSVFGQLQFELTGVSQEGMRKLEITTIKKVLYPSFDSIPPSIAVRLRMLVQSEQALIFRNIQQRKTDRLWAEVIAPGSASDCLTQAFELFQEMVDERQGFGRS